MSHTHTLGPWQIGVFDSKGADIIAPSSNDVIASVSRISDARLIAAAPDLLEALQWALDQLEDDPCPDHQAALYAARSTIARATGNE